MTSMAIYHEQHIIYTILTGLNNIKFQSCTSMRAIHLLALLKYMTQLEVLLVLETPRFAPLRKVIKKKYNEGLTRNKMNYNEDMYKAHQLMTKLVKTLYPERRSARIANRNANNI